MDINKFLLSVIEQDTAPVLICNLEHIVLYMNPAAKQRYGYAGGKEMIGKSLANCHNNNSMEKIEKCLVWFSADAGHNIVHESYNGKENKDVYIVALRDDSGRLMGYYEKHEYRTRDLKGFYDLY